MAQGQDGSCVKVMNSQGDEKKSGPAGICRAGFIILM